MDYVTLRALLLVSDLDSVRLTDKLERVSLMTEPGRKLCIYDSHAPISSQFDKAAAEEAALPHKSQGQHGVPPSNARGPIHLVCMGRRISGIQNGATT